MFKEFVTKQNTIKEDVKLRSEDLKIIKGINSTINKVDSNLSYKDFANIISNILIEQYGSHNFKPFLQILTKNLKENNV